MLSSHGAHLIELRAQRAMLRREDERRRDRRRARSAAPARRRCRRRTSSPCWISARNASFSRDAARLAAGRRPTSRRGEPALASAAPAGAAAAAASTAVIVAARGRRRRRGVAGARPARERLRRTMRRRGGVAVARPGACLQLLNQVRQRHELPQVDPPQQRHLEVISRLQRRADVELRLGEHVERAHQILGARTARRAPAGARARPSAAISGSPTRDGSIVSTSRSRVSRASSRHTSRRS